MKREAGFSLLEVIISTAVLAILSGFILEMFMSSIYLNKKAYNLDMGANNAAYALETLKAEKIPESGIAITKRFDSNWKEMTETGASDNIRFIMIANAVEDSVYEYEVYTSFDFIGNYSINSAKSKMYWLNAAVYEVKPDNGRAEIVNLQTRKYQQTG